MRHTVYFLVEPNDAARRNLPVRAGANAELLLDPFLTSRDYSDRSAWRESEVELAVKLIYLSRLREYDPFRSDFNAESVLGSHEISADLFERWWTIRRLHLEEGPSESMEGYLKLTIQKVRPTGNRVVDDWIEGVRRGAV